MRFTGVSAAVAALIALSAPAYAGLSPNALIDNSVQLNALIDNAVQLNSAGRNAALANGAAEIAGITLANGEVLAK
jgi:hypothetical protein